ncbi:hypothetical protein FHR60_000296 [Xanthomonas arboricola]|uniref:Uncharacterized protein n=1 Tax=Xanthomonas cannabis TaxID=1885674 RepID=A0ABR6JFU8_9XANT|nr:hypothetical protein [Xanthomonas cannabis]
MQRQAGPARCGNPACTARIGQHGQARAWPQEPRRMIQGDLQPGVASRRLRIPARQGIEHRQHTALPRPRRDRRLAGGAAQGRDTVALPLRQPCRHGAGTGGLHRLVTHAGTEEERRRGVGHDQAQALALGLKQLGMRPPGARGDAPIDMPRIVTGHVLARLGIFHPTPARGGRHRPHQPMPATPRLPAMLRGAAQRDQLGKAGAQAVTGHGCRWVRWGEGRNRRHRARAGGRHTSVARRPIRAAESCPATR